MCVNDLNQGIGLVFQQKNPGILPEYNFPLLVNDNVNPAGQGQQPVIRIIAADYTAIRI